MAALRALAIAAVALLTVMTSSACGGEEAKPSAPTAEETIGAEEVLPDEPPVPTETTLQQPKAGATIEPSATLTAVPGASQLAAPKGAPRTIQGFPIPRGSKVQDPGPIDETWQFDIHTDDPDEVIAFYKRALPRMGFRVRTDVTYTLGDEDVHWDLAFDGKVSGTMARDPENGVVFVVVNPPGQPAIAGE